MAAEELPDFEEEMEAGDDQSKLRALSQSSATELQPAQKKKHISHTMENQIQEDKRLHNETVLKNNSGTAENTEEPGGQGSETEQPTKDKKRKSNAASKTEVAKLKDATERRFNLHESLRLKQDRSDLSGVIVFTPTSRVHPVELKRDYYPWLAEFILKSHLADKVAFMKEVDGELRLQLRNGMDKWEMDWSFGEMVAPYGFQTRLPKCGLKKEADKMAQIAHAILWEELGQKPNVHTSYPTLDSDGERKWDWSIETTNEPVTVLISGMVGDGEMLIKALPGINIDDKTVSGDKVLVAMAERAPRQSNWAITTLLATQGEVLEMAPQKLGKGKGKDKVASKGNNSKNTDAHNPVENGKADGKKGNKGDGRKGDGKKGGIAKGKGKKGAWPAVSRWW